MLNFRFPCWPGAIKSQFKEDDIQTSTGVEDARRTRDVKDLQRPRAREYAGETAKEFLKVLEAVAVEIPVPGLGTAVKPATSLIQACEDSSATLERAEELKLRIKALVTVLVDELKGKKADEIQEKLKNDVEALEKDLKYIQTQLDDIASQHAFLVIFFRGINEDKVRKCVGRLDHSLERFNLTRTLDRSNILDRLEKQIISFHSMQQNTLQDLKVDMGKVLAILGGRYPLGSSSSHPRSARTSVPRNTGIFHGRDAIVAELVHILTNGSEGQKHLHACLLGPGGMGKTSTALAVMANPDVKKCFQSRNLIWVPCVKATSVSLFLDTLCSSVGVSQNTGNTLNDILSELNGSDERVVLLLDNFETPWNMDGGPSETERILRELHEIPRVTLFITMRSSAPPCEGIYWHSIDLTSVDPGAASQIYADIYPNGSSDPCLPELLRLVGYMPLAVTLMAKLAKTTMVPAETLVKEYNRIGTALLSQGIDAEHSMDISISLSVTSTPIKKHPEALELLATIAMLPVGTTFETLSHWWAPSFENLLGALQVLSETSLVERRNHIIFVLPVIGRYILHPSRFPDKVRNAMIDSARSFLAQHRSSPGDASHKENAAAISAEEGNLQAILLQTTPPTGTPGLIEDLLILANHQEATRPRTDVIEHALKFTQAMEGTGSLPGSVLFCYGGILFNVGRYDDAIKQYTLARETFLLSSEKTRAGECLLKMAAIYNRSGSQPFAMQNTFIMDAKSEFESTNDTRGVAICLYRLGRVHWYHSQNLEAAGFFTSARKMFAELQEMIYLADCSLDLGWVYFEGAKYDDARTLAESAVEDFERLGCYDTRAQRLLSRILIVKGDHDGALQRLLQSLSKSKSHGNPFDIARTLDGMGRCWARMGNKGDARKAFEESCRYYSSLHTKLGDGYVIMCNFFINRLENPLLVPNGEEKAIWVKSYCEDTEEIVQLAP